MRRIYFVLLALAVPAFCLSLTSSPKAAKASLTVGHVSVERQPAEFEKQKALWLIWPLRDHLRGYSNEQVTLSIINAVLPHCNIRLSVASEELEAKARKLLPKKALEDGRIEILRMKSADFWVRDMGPTFVLTEEGKKAVVDYNFDGWGYAPPGDPDTQVEESFDRRVGE